MSVPKRHHTVPQLILNSFVNGNGTISTWLAAQGRWVELALTDASVRKHFNTKADGTFELETFFSTEIEGPFATVRERLLSETSIQVRVEEREVISAFFVAQFLRVPSARAAVARRADEYFRAQIGEQHCKMAKLAREYREPYGAKERLETEARIRGRIESADYQIDFTRQMIVTHARELSPKFWRGIWAPMGFEFVMSDAPAKAFHVQRGLGGNDVYRVLDYQGIARDDVLLFLPISPSAGLLAAATAELLPQKMAVDSLNEMTMMDASQIYALTRSAAGLKSHSD